PPRRTARAAAAPRLRSPRPPSLLRLSADPATTGHAPPPRGLPLSPTTHLPHEPRQAPLWNAPTARRGGCPMTPTDGRAPPPTQTGPAAEGAAAAKWAAPLS